jgi:hypothetical protein
MLGFWKQQLGLSLKRIKQRKMRGKELKSLIRVQENILINKKLPSGFEFPHTIGIGFIPTCPG